MSEIESLTEKVTELDSSFTWWTNAGLLLVFLTAVVAFAVWLAGKKANDKGMLLKNAQNELLAAKDRQLASELKEKDRAIAEAAARGSEANERAARLEKEAAEARTRQADSERKLEAERMARLELEESLAPRSLAWTDHVIDRLRKFSGTSFFVFVVFNNPEAEALGNRITSILRKAGWQESTEMPPFPPISPGVTIEMKMREFASSPLVNNTFEAANELVGYLEANRIETVSHASPSKRIPEGIVLIVIGPKPHVHTSRTLAEVLDAKTIELIDNNKKRKKEEMETRRK